MGSCFAVEVGGGPACFTQRTIVHNLATSTTVIVLAGNSVLQYSVMTDDSLEVSSDLLSESL